MIFLAVASINLGTFSQKQSPQGFFLLVLHNPLPGDRCQWIQSCRHGAFSQRAPREVRTIASL
jgi:hypothetical protein